MSREELEALGAAMRGRDTLLMADCVTTLGGVEFDFDGWGIDYAYSCTQKCLAAPPGTARHTVHRICSYHITCTTLIITSLSKYVRRLTEFGGPHHAAHCTRSADLMMCFIVVCLPEPLRYCE